MERTATFIDGAHLDKLCMHSFGGARLDHAKLAEIASTGYSLLRSYYYDCPPYQSNPPTADERARMAGKRRFFTALSRLDRFEVRQGKLAFRGRTAEGQPIFVQKRVDIMLGVDMVQLAATRQIHRAVLIAGDSDFLPAIDAIKSHGVLTVLFHGPPGQYHQELWDGCDERVEMSAAMIERIKR